MEETHIPTLNRNIKELESKVDTQKKEIKNLKKLILLLQNTIEKNDDT
jgi:cell division protein FtsL|tara:strand:- start:574 stop:717 length:144 start_codon:yes stop_codon:yes gene_type:complete